MAEEIITCSRAHHMQPGDIITTDEGLVFVVRKINGYTIMVLRQPMRWWHMRWGFIGALSAALGLLAGYYDWIKL